MSPVINCALFTNPTVTAATSLNFLVDGTIGALIVSQQATEMAAQKTDGTPYTAGDAGLLRLGYGIFIIAFVSVGEKPLQRFGPGTPMIWAALITRVCCGPLMTTHRLLGQYVIMAIIAYGLSVSGSRSTPRCPTSPDD